MSALQQIIIYLLWFACLANLLGTLLGYLSVRWWFFELFSHFRVQYAIALLICSLGFLVIGDITGMGLSVAGEYINLIAILPLKQNKPQKRENAPTYRVLSANVYQPNRAYGRLMELVEKEKPDFISLIEVNQTWIDQLQPLRREYPYLADSLRDDNYGLAQLSKRPFRSTRTRNFGEADVPSLVSELELDGRVVTMITTHPPPPKGGKNAHFRNGQLAEIASFTASCSHPVLLMGDINMTSWSAYFSKLLKDGRLHDSRQGFGVQASWPSKIPFFLVPLDHILVSSGIEVQNRKVGASIGSDHYPVILDFSLE